MKSQSASAPRPPGTKTGPQRDAWFVLRHMRYLVATIVFLRLFHILVNSPPSPNHYEATAAAGRKDGVDPPDKTPRVTTPLSRSEQDAWIHTNFKAADPAFQEWCTSALLEGTHWHSPNYSGGAQYSQDVFLARNVLFERWIRPGKKGFYVEAGANHYQRLSSTYFFDKCLGWEGLCVEPQNQYHEGLTKNRSCTLVPLCLTKERSHMMLGGLPEHRGAGMFVRPLPADGRVPANETTRKGQLIHWEVIECAPLEDILREYSPGRKHVDLFVLDVEGAEMTVLDTIDWGRTTEGGNYGSRDGGISFSTLQIEVEHMGAQTKENLTKDMLQRGYERSHNLGIDHVFVPKQDGHGRQKAATNGDFPVVWQPPQF